MGCVSAVDLFCGAGGLTHGFEQAGIPVKVGYDIDPACKFPYEHNNHAKFVCKSVEDITGIDLAKNFAKGDIKILVGCAPCQLFSTYSRRYETKKSSKWQLLNDFARLIAESTPKIVSMENVIQLKRYQVYHDFTATLKKLGYFLSLYEVDCATYGIPQTRKRLVLFASKFGKINLIAPTHDKANFETVRDTIGHLEPLTAGQASEKDKLHQCSKLSELNLRRIRASKPGGTWRDWSKDLIAECHLKKTGKTYIGVYGRMEWYRPSPTITTQCFGFGNGRFGHPEQDRAISLREAALLQTFPADYEFVEPEKPIMFSIVGRLIGNAVPVKLGCVIAKSILQHIDKHTIR
ncbi:MAG: DNA cytosine methyltransferase [Moorea sp. SIO2B7]|nr:DNA cytosine methyltransferase [Moorena sp. SIO2B7]